MYCIMLIFVNKSNGREANAKEKCLCYTVLLYNFIKGSVQWKNNLDLYCSLVLVMNIGMYDLVILCLVYPLLGF